MSELMKRLAGLAAQDDTLLAEVADGSAADPSRYSDMLAAGPRCAGHPADLALVLEMVYEGYLLHHRRARVLRGDDPDLALLAGDRLYALGLERLAAAGDIDSVTALADAIALCAQAHAIDDEHLADALWEAAATELGWGPDAGLSEAKVSAAAGSRLAEAELRSAALSARTATRATT